MFRRLAPLLLATTLATSAFASNADARGFATAPSSEGRPYRPDDRLVEDFAPTGPRMSEAVRNKLRAVLTRRRAKNVRAFRAYAERGIYPRNYVTNGELNVWIDGDGRMCAAATMIFKSGARSLVRRIAREDNYIRLADVTEGPVLDWILTSGLTHAEVVAIQAPMVGGPRESPNRGPMVDWRVVDEDRLRAHYTDVLAALDRDGGSSIDAAITALAHRPDLIAKLIGA